LLKLAGRVVPHLQAFLAVSEGIQPSSPWAVLWTTPSILISSIVIAWGAESAQFFVAQGFALAILAWMQTLPEFAVEAVLAWRQQADLLLANLTGAVRLLTGLAWPMIYMTAAVVHRRRTGSAMKRILLDKQQSVEVLALFFPLLYAVFIWYKRSLHLYDAFPLIGFYAAYLILLSKLPPQEKEGVENLEKIPRAIVTAPRGRRNLAIGACFLLGGGLIYFTAEPFLGSLVALATAVGIPTFVVIQWLAPVISEFPELLSTFYFARQEEKAPMALMNITSSNINQWTLLFAMLPVVFSISRHSVSAIPFDAKQQAELLLTIAQSAVGFVFLMNMAFEWWEAAAMLTLFLLQFVLPPFFGEASKNWLAYSFLVWAGSAVALSFVRKKSFTAWTSFRETWREHVRGA
jgi:cation:H+ antiporter